MKYLLTLFLMPFGFFCSAQQVDTLTSREKIFGLSRLWSEAKYNFAHFKCTQQAWDSVYQSFIPKVLASKSTFEYYQELKKFYVFLEDGHTEVYYPQPVANNLLIHPLRGRLIDGKVIIASVLNDTLTKMGITAGAEILRVNGIDVVEYAQRFVLPLVCASTEQYRISTAYGQNIFLTQRNKPLNLEIKSKDKVIQKISLDRMMHSKPQGANITLDYPKKDVAYLKINSFGQKKFKQKIDSLYSSILSSSALIIDLRENGGGDSRNAEYLLSHLINIPYQNSKWSVRQHTPSFVFQSNASWIGGEPETIYPVKQKQIYKGEIIVLIGERTFSAAEDFLVAFDNAKRGIKIGLPTAGSSGQQIYFDLPGGGFARVCAKKDTYPNGEIFVGKGIIPDILVDITLGDFQAGKDNTLQTALNILQKN